MPEQDNWKEKICEKNCPDYNGMQILHNEECDCSCHKNITDWKEKLDVEIKLWLMKEGYTGGYAEMKTKDIEEIILNALSSQAHALKEQMRACVPKEPINQGFYYGHGFNDCREQTLSAIESIEI